MSTLKLRKSCSRKDLTAKSFSHKSHVNNKNNRKNIRKLQQVNLTPKTFDTM